MKKNYGDDSRINQIVPKSNVKLINSDDLKLYGCPVEGTFVIVAKQSKMKFRKDDVISSTQAEGVFHKIQDVTKTGEYVHAEHVAFAKQQFSLIIYERTVER